MQSDTTTAATTTHAYAAAGDVTARLVVTDNDGADSTEFSANVAPTDPPASDIAFRASATSTTTNATQRITEPASVTAGDQLLLFATSNTVTSVATPPAGWTLVGTRQSSTDTQTLLYSRVATASDAGSQQTIIYSASTKAVLTLLAYSGTKVNPNALQVVASAGETVNRAAHTTPAVTVPTDGAWVVSYWADKSSATTSWTLPASQSSARRRRSHRFRSRHLGRLRPWRVRARGSGRRTHGDRRLEFGQGDHVVGCPEACERTEREAGRVVHDQLHSPRLHG